MTWAYDAVGRRTSVVNSGSAFAATAFNAWGYNPRSELTASNLYLGEDPLNPPVEDVTAKRRAYTYDNIGNRKDSTKSSGGGWEVFSALCPTTPTPARLVGSG